MASRLGVFLSQVRFVLVVLSSLFHGNGVLVVPSECKFVFKSCPLYHFLEIWLKIVNGHFPSFGSNLVVKNEQKTDTRAADVI